jgi:hypothetical protein
MIRYFLGELMHPAYVFAACLCVIGAFAIGNSDAIMTSLGGLAAAAAAEQPTDSTAEAGEGVEVVNPSVVNATAR